MLFKFPSSHDPKYMKATLRNDTVFRVQKFTGIPVSRGMDKAINQILDELESLRKKN